MPPLKTGVEAFWDNADFLKGLGQFVQGVSRANEASSGMKATAPLSGLSGAAGGAAQSVLALSSSAVAAGIWIADLGKKALETAGEIWNFAKASVTTAARVEELTLVMQLLGQRAGYSQEELTAQTDAIRKLGIQTDVALGLQSQFARFNLDVSQATDLARAAQDAAVLTMENSSEALQGLLYGIITYNQRIIRTHGLNVDMSKAFETFAATLGKTSEALTEQEKVQAALNAVIEAGGAIQGVYLTAQESAGKQARSLERYYYDLRVALGVPFLGAYSNIIKAVTELTKSFTASISEGGRFYPVMTALGAIASIITGAFRSLASSIANFLVPVKSADETLASFGARAESNAKGLSKVGTEMADSIANPLVDAALDAIEWGANLAVNFATGIIEGASTAITAALEWLSGMLTSWLSPGSPPKILPDIDLWGKDTIEEYLHGMTEADFSALKAIQAPFKQVLSTLIDEGTLTKEQMGPLFASISEEITKAIATGNVSEELFNKIREAGGEYGTELAELARNQIDLANAEKQVKTAEDALADARKRQSEAGAAVNKETMEYNRMLRSGASAEELKRQKQKIDNARKARDAAAAEAKTAEQNLDTAKENVENLKDQASIQSEILSQLLELAQARIPPEEKIPTGAGGEGKPTTPTGPSIPGGEPPDLGSIEDAFKGAVDRIKQMILERLGKIWDEIVAIWNEKMGPAIEKLAPAWEKFKTAVQPIIDWLKIKWETFLNWLKNFIPNTLANIKKWWSEHGESIKTIVTSYWNAVVRIVTGVWNYLVMLWNKYGGQLIVIASKIWTWISEGVGNFMENIGLIIDLGAAIIKGDWGEVWEIIKKIAANWWEDTYNFLVVIWETIKLAFTVFLDALKGVWDIVWTGIKKTVEVIWAAILLAAVLAWEGLKIIIATAINAVKTFLENTWNFIKDTIIAVWNTMLFGAQQIWNYIQLAIQDPINTVKDTLETLWTAIKDASYTVWLALYTKASEVWESIKSAINTAISTLKEVLDGLWTGIQTAATTVWNTISSKATELWTSIKDSIKTAIDDAKTALDTTWSALTTAATTTWDTLKTSISEKANAIKDAVATAISELPGKIATFVTDMVQGGKDLIQGIIDGAGQMAGALATAVSGIVNDAIEAIKKALGIASPSKVMIGFGKQTMKGLEEGIRITAELPKNAMTASVNSMMPTQNAAVPVMNGPSYRTMNMNIQNNLSNSMDVLALTSLIERVVVNALRR